MDKQKALEILNKNMQNINLKRHCLGVSYAMGGIYDYFKDTGRLEDSGLTREDWEVFGILHDSDYEITKDDWEKHTLVTLEWLEKEGVSKEDSIYKAVMSHNNKITKLREPQTQMEWALECCDELTGFVVACALVQPDKKLGSVDIDSILKKWKTPAFARAVDRSQIEQCKDKLNTELKDFIGIVLRSMKDHTNDLGL